MKSCNRCKRKKATCHFYKWKKRRYGICKRCTRKSGKIYRRKNRAVLAERDKKRNKKRRLHKSAQSKIYRLKNIKRLRKEGRARYRKFRNKIRSRNSRYYHSNAKLITKRRRVCKYGLSDADFRKMMRAQKGVCKICGRKAGKKPLHVDHDHQTKKVRGLLCHKCNLGLGLFSDSLRVLKEAVTYLEDVIE